VRCWHQTRAAYPQRRGSNAYAAVGKPALCDAEGARDLRQSRPSKSSMYRVPANFRRLAGCSEHKTFMHYETTKHSCSWNNKRFLLFGTTQDSWTKLIQVPNFCTRTKNSRFHSKAPYRRHSVLCHDVAVARGFTGISDENLDGNLAGIS
jgi:hypothetical protein